MPTAKLWIDKLNLIPHPEGGYYNEIYRCEETISDGLPARYNGPRAIATSIYYLLESGQFSSLHRLKSDETWHFYYGSPLELHIIYPDKKHQLIILGNDISKGEILQYTVKQGCWFGGTPQNENSYSLLGTAVSPGFDFDDFEIGRRDELLKLFPKHEYIILKLTNN